MRNAFVATVSLSVVVVVCLITAIACRRHRPLSTRSLSLTLASAVSASIIPWGFLINSDTPKRLVVTLSVGAFFGLLNVRSLRQWFVTGLTRARLSSAANFFRETVVQNKDKSSKIGTVGSLLRRFSGIASKRRARNQSEIGRLETTPNLSDAAEQARIRERARKFSLVKRRHRATWVGFRNSFWARSPSGSRCGG
ncbi:MAG: hypothetical protein MHM6MM_002719 [Cercozoa sp. M6MM]